MRRATPRPQGRVPGCPNPCPPYLSGPGWPRRKRGKRGKRCARPPWLGAGAGARRSTVSAGGRRRGGGEELGEEEPVTTAEPRPELAPVVQPRRTVARRALMPALGVGGATPQGPLEETGRHCGPGAAVSGARHEERAGAGLKDTPLGREIWIGWHA